jgi:branched-chain amino acid transport system substrate-binding protein
MTFSSDPRKSPAATEVVKRFRDKGIAPEGYVLYTYAALQAWKQATEKAKSVERDEIVKALNDTEFDTVIGILTTKVIQLSRLTLSIAGLTALMSR